MNRSVLKRLEKLEKQLEVRKSPEAFIILHDLFEDEKIYTPNGQETSVKVSDANIEQLLNESESRTGLKPTIITICVVTEQPDDMMKYAPSDEYKAWLKKYPPEKYERYKKKYPLHIPQ